MHRLLPLFLCLSALPRTREARAAPGPWPWPWEVRASAGGEINADPHGVVDLGLRRGPLSLQLYTDTLDVRYTGEGPRGRFTVGVRGEALAAGLLISPWRDGAPDPQSALFASYAGADGGWVRYLPASFYAGVQGQTRVYFFGARGETRIPVPGPIWLTTLEAVAGHQTAASHVWLRAGADARIGSASPHAYLEGTYHPSGTLAPIVELRAGWAWGQDFLTRTRLGGLNPYVVPLAGAAWAEWWVEDFAATRLGVSARVWQLELGLVTDVAAFDDRLAAGFAFLGRWRYRRLFADLALGYAPWIPRQEGISRVSFWCLAGIDWGGFRRL